MNLLVTGGAGYIGSHVVRQLIELGHQVTVFDNLSRGSAIDQKAKLVVGDLVVGSQINDCIRKGGFDCVMHFAASIEAGESMEMPGIYFSNNVSGGINLLNAMRSSGVSRLIFSSSAAVYGNPARVPVNEFDPLVPVNPYGESKLMMERIIGWFGKVHDFKAVSFRYFNAAGAHSSAQIGESHNPETHLIPRLLDCAGNGSPAIVNGTDYPTRDGTCIRDFVHVEDLARAHILGLEMTAGKSAVFNVGSEQGYSVLEVINACRKITGVDFDVSYGGRRPGDPACLVADSGSLKRELGWVPKKDLSSMIRSAWAFKQRVIA